MLDFNVYAFAAGREAGVLNRQQRLQIAIDIAEGQQSDSLYYN